MATVTCDGVFNAVASPSDSAARRNFLVSTSAVNANDVWAVGHSGIPGGYDQTLVLHWDGTIWSIVPSINPGPFHNDLNGVVAISANDVWAVGEYSSSTEAVAFAFHWNGISWNWFALKPSPQTLVSTLTAVTATSSNDVWAVGSYASAGILSYGAHWDGISWTPTTAITGPSFGYDDELTAVSAWSPTDVWAVGVSRPQTPGAALQSWALHLSGTTWSTVATPNSASGDNLIFGVNALEANHAVGVGMGNYIKATTNPPVAGQPRQSQAWDLVAPGISTTSTLGATGLGTGDNILLGVSRSGAGLQAVGYKRSAPAAPRQTLVIPAAWDSVGHTLTWAAPGASASPGGGNDVLFSAAALSPHGFWATGYTQGSGAPQTLTELYCALRFNVASPVAYLGEPFSMTVTAQNPNTTTLTGYRGTVHFTSSDPGAVLPADYTFTPGDAGTHAFSGVVLNTTGLQTIIVADAALPFVTFTTVFNVSCRGACPGPSGTPGARDANPGPAGTAGGRDANQSGVSPPGPRRPMLGAGVASSDTRSGGALATAMGPAGGGAAIAAASTQPAAAQATAAAPVEAEVAAIPVSQSEQPLTVSGGDMMAASHHPLTKVEDSPGYQQLALIPLAIISLALLVVRRQRNRRLIGHTRP